MRSAAAPGGEGGTGAAAARAPRGRAVLVAVAALAGLTAACTAPTGTSQAPGDDLAAASPTASPVVSPPPRPLAVSANGRFLQRDDGSPFFYLGDTAWELFHRLTREEAETYLEDRRDKGFTVIQAVALAEQGGLEVANAYGHHPLVDRDPTRPLVRPGASDDYWDHVDHVVDKAGEKGLYVGFLPTWGDKVEKLWGRDGEPIFTTANARAYGRFLGTRYRQRTNLIWILGGDRGPNAHDIDVWREMARGLREGDGGRHLVTYHPGGEKTSSTLLHTDPLFDFNLLQSGHCASEDVAAGMVVADYEKTPPKPVLDGEPHYEDHPKCFEPDKGWWDGHDARRSAYLQTFSGAAGHTYGNHNVWQFHAPGRTGASWPRTYWPEALDQPGAAQVGHVRRLLESRPFFTRIPDQTLITSEPGSGEALIRATRDAEGSYAAVYAGTGQAFSVDLSALSGTAVRAWWYDPREGTASAPWEISDRRGAVPFDPPGDPGRTNDWVLVLDDAARQFPPPGTGGSDS